MNFFFKKNAKPPPVTNQSSAQARLLGRMRKDTRLLLALMHLGTFLQCGSDGVGTEMQSSLGLGVFILQKQFCCYDCTEAANNCPVACI